MTNRAMSFSKQSIMEMDIGTLSLKEKEYLLKKYFPDNSPNWKKKLSSEWEELQRKRVWDAYYGSDIYGDFGAEYRITHEQLKIKANLIGNTGSFQNRKGVRVTDFTKWIMRLYLGFPSASSLMRGKDVEKSVARLVEPQHDSEWILKYRDPLDKLSDPLKISSLIFGGKPLWGSPDLVYENVITGELLIVERKASDKPIPINGWPNLKAQLWAYSHIDEFKGATKITLVGEVWGFVDEKLKRRGILRWSRSDKDFDNECMELFSLYGGIRKA